MCQPMCPICLEEIADGQDKHVCIMCKNPMHASCQRKARESDERCCMCRGSCSNLTEEQWKALLQKNEFTRNDIRVLIVESLSKRLKIIYGNTQGNPDHMIEELRDLISDGAVWKQTWTQWLEREGDMRLETIQSNVERMAGDSYKRAREYERKKVHAMSRSDATMEQLIEATLSVLCTWRMIAKKRIQYIVDIDDNNVFIVRNGSMLHVYVID